MTPQLLVFFVGTALWLVGTACVVASLFHRAPGAKRPWTELWAPSDSFRGPGRHLNRGGYALTLAGVAIMMMVLAWHRYFPY